MKKVTKFGNWPNCLSEETRDMAGLVKWADPITKREHYIIAKADLQHGHYYTGHCRNASLARWDAEAACFKHWREKWGSRFVEEINHPEDDIGFDVFVVTGWGAGSDGIPLKGKSEKCPHSIPSKGPAQCSDGHWLGSVEHPVREES